MILPIHLKNFILPCGQKVSRVLIAIFPKLLQKYSLVYSTKKSCRFNHTVSLSFKKQNGIQRNTGLLFENMYFSCTYSTKTKILSMLRTEYFLKIASFPTASKKNQSVLIAKISSRKTNQSAKISCHTVGANAFP